MPAAYTPTSAYATDPVLPDGSPANVAAFKELANRSLYARDVARGVLVWTHAARATTGGAAGGSFKVYVPPIAEVALLDGSTSKVFALASETELTSAAHFAAGTLAASTWYYVYATVSGGALTFQVATTVPDAATGNTWKTGATYTHRYLFCFRTRTAGTSVAPLPFTMRSGIYLYRHSAITAAGGPGVDTNIALAAGVATGYTSVNLTFRVPPHARLARLWAHLVADAGGARYASLVTSGDTTNSFQPYAAASTFSDTVVDVECSSAQLVDYLVSNAAAALDLTVMGFAE